MYLPRFAPTVGVAPGTVTMQLGETPRPYPARIRWDIIGVVGGGALVVSMLAGLIANAVSSR